MVVNLITVVGKALRIYFMGLFAILFIINLFSVVFGRKKAGFEAEVIQIGYMIVSLLAVICLEIL